MCIHEQGVELINLKAEQLVIRADLLDSLQDLEDGGDESGGGSSRKPLPSPYFRLFLVTRDIPSPLHFSTISSGFRQLPAATPFPAFPPYSGS